MTQRRWFYQLAGEIGRAQFLVNSLMIGAIFGASFSLLVLTGGRTPQPGAIAATYSLLPLWLSSTLLGIICGPILVLTSGLTCLWLGLFYAAIFLVGSLASSPGTWTLTARIILLSASLVMASMTVMAYANVAKRVRNILEDTRRTHLWSVTASLLSMVPIVGTVSYWVLLMMPARSSSSSEGTGVPPKVFT